nr:MAG TPA: hypothetical protein [Caudoviricetes sp.]
MRRLFKARLTPSFLHKGYTYCMVSEEDVRKLVYSKRVQQIYYMDGIHVMGVFKRSSKTDGWWASSYGEKKYEFGNSGMYENLMKHHISQRNTIKFKFYPNLKNNIAHMLKLIKMNGQYYLGIPWMLYDYTYPYPSSIINGDLSKFLDISTVYTIVISVRPEMFSSVIYRIGRTSRNGWVASMSIGNHTIRETMDIHDIDASLKSIDPSTIESVYVYHMKEMSL